MNRLAPLMSSVSGDYWQTPREILDLVRNVGPIAVETGRAARTVTTVHNGVKPTQRARILERDGRCVLCGSKDALQVGHLISVASGLAVGLTEAQLNDDANLAAMCAECSLGLGERPLPLWLVAPLLKARLRGQH